MTAIEFNNQLVNMEDIMGKFALRLTSNREDAKDLLQETYLKALTHKDKFVEFTNLKAWVFTIMKNTFINNYRKSLRESNTFDNIDDFLLMTNLNGPHLESPYSEFSYAEINKAINALEDEFKVPFSMLTAGYKYKEIAEILDIKIGTIKSRIFFTRKKLMESLRDYK